VITFQFGGFEALFGEAKPTKATRWRRDWREEGRFDSPGLLNVKTMPPPSLYFGFNLLLVFSRLSSFCVFRSIFRWFGSSIVGTPIHTRIHHYFSRFFSECSLMDHLQSLVCLFQVSFPSCSNLYLRHWFVGCTNISLNN